MSDVTKSQLETLPNELFLEIFSYTGAKDLLSFKGLNQRIDSIITKVKTYMDYLNEQDTRELLSVFSLSQVIRLEMNWPFRFLDVNMMQNLRSLTIDCQYIFDRRWERVSTTRYCQPTRKHSFYF